MKTIDHDPNDNKKFPDYGDRLWAEEKFGPDRSWKDLLAYIVPFAVVGLVMMIWRGY
ncbi:hypothetical protein ACQZ4Z_13055 [Agrobacterium vitis]|uniref:hypothetical protein n=1 Tax=Agrobacterium vitis TaxID=373 RepID=UPI001573201A|nr:hypothetical protein [Agrobacterium vitis]NSZ42843.1 hypothetical protein [Agrobacterium vitis]